MTVLIVVVVILVLAAVALVRLEAPIPVAAVTDAMARWQHGVVGNPSGSHKAARDARRAVEEARDEVGAFVGAITFSGSVRK